MKWAHFDDTVCEAQSFKKLLLRYCSHAVYLEYVTRWYDDVCCPLVRKAMDKHLTSLPLVAFSPPLLPLPGRRRVDAGGEQTDVDLHATVALRGRHRGTLPHKLRGHTYFKLTKWNVPPAIRYVARGHEPKWITIRPSTRTGEVESNAPCIPIALSWLDKSLSIMEGADEEEVAQYDTFTPNVDEHRIKVSGVLTHRGGGDIILI